MLRKLEFKQWLIILATVLSFVSFYQLYFNPSKMLTNKIILDSAHTDKPQAQFSKNQLQSIKVKSNKTQNMVHSYQGTHPDGDIHVDVNGNIIVDKDLKLLFDYYLTAIGELPLDQMRKYLLQYASNQLNPDQLEQLLRYFDLYKDYLINAESFALDLDTDLTMLEKMNWLSEYRFKILGQEMAEAFFADEQGYIEFLLAEKDSDDWSEQQQQWIQAENQATEFQDIVIENREFAADVNLTSDQIYQYRVDKYGHQAADRLGQLDQQRAEWQSIVDSYFQQRHLIQNQQITMTLAQLNLNYSQQDLRRLQALWRIESL
jgi:lipase chaperone LimK